MTNPLDGIDDLLTEYAFAVASREQYRSKGHVGPANTQDKIAFAARSRIREKVAKANLIINRGLEAGNVQRLGHLHEAEQQLGALLAAGVDNWEGYADAMASLEKE
jgi:hypothetical protein